MASLLTLGGCTSVNKDIPNGIASLPATSRAEDQVKSSVVYEIGLLDELSIVVFREPDLSAETIVVDAVGNINLPIVGSLPALGKTVDQLEQIIEEKLNERYLRNAQVSVSVKKPSSYTFTIDGEVKRPGTYAIPGQVTLLQAVAIGEGALQSASLRDVIVFRTRGGQRYAARFDVKRIRQALDNDPVLMPGDLVVVGYSAGKQIYRDLLTALPGVAGIFVALNQN